MTSLAHRGLWAEADERNTLAAFRDAFAHGWGVELDVRDLDGALVISHDPPAAGALPFGAVVDSFVARVLARLVAMVRLLGTEAAVVGISPAVAVTLVELGVPFQHVKTARDAEQGMAQLRRARLAG